MRLSVSATTLVLVFGLFVTGSASAPQRAGAGEQGWIKLFNGKDLSGWDVYLGPKMDVKGQKLPGTETGLNKDPEKVFSVAQVDGGPVLRISGVIGGGISTVQSFENYHLRMQMKWGPGNPWNRERADSGLLYHAGGDHGLDAGFWMRSFEFQVMPQMNGDFIPILGCVAEIPTSSADGKRFHFDPKGELRTFTRVKDIKGFGDHVDRLPSIKDPANNGWVTLEVYTVGQTALHVVDGTVAMIVRNTRLHENGTTRPLTGGKIQLQSEGSEVYYRNIELRHITELPK